MSETNRAMLIAYDGSAEAKRALTYASQLLQPTHAHILTVWEPAGRQGRPTDNDASDIGWATDIEYDDTGNTDFAYTDASETCREGVELAKELGLSAEGHLVESTTAIWAVIVEAAADLKPDVIVTGSRAMAGLQALFQSNTSDNVLHHAGLPLFIVPPEEE